MPHAAPARFGRVHADQLKQLLVGQGLFTVGNFVERFFVNPRAQRAQQPPLGVHHGEGQVGIEAEQLQRVQQQGFAFDFDYAAVHHIAQQTVRVR